MRICYDSTNPNDIPTSARMVGYYVDGIYAVSESVVRNRFPQAVLVPISAVGTNAGIVADCEAGDLTVPGVVSWVRMRRTLGIDPTVYCNETYGWPQVRAAFQSAGVAEPHYWCANYDNQAVLRAGQVARQYANPTLTGHHYDLSVVADHWPGVDSQGDTMTPTQETQLLADVAGIHAFLSGKYATLDAELVADINLIPKPPGITQIQLSVADENALASAIATAIVPLLPQSSKPPVAPQAVKDWWAALTHWLGLS